VATDLFVAVGGMSAAAITRAIPPSCRRVVAAPSVVIDADVAVLEAPTWTPRRGVRHLVPSFSLLGAAPCSFRFELSALSSGGWTPWVATATIGHAAFAAGPAAPGALIPEIDMYTACPPVERVRLRVRIHPAGALTGPWMMALSASDLAPAPVERNDGAVLRLSVPARSQMEEAPDIRDRICSPACVAMVLEFWGHGTSVSDIAAEVLHDGLDRYGVWPAAIHAAARRGVAGYLLRFPDWASAAWCLARGMPVIASIRFERGELQGAPIARTDGHLVVLLGTDGAHVLVNDPAAPSPGEVPRRYRREEFCRAWLDRGGVGYVLFRVRSGGAHRRSPRWPPPVSSSRVARARPALVGGDDSTRSCAQGL
jgi:hypothetical protein